MNALQGRDRAGFVPPTIVRPVTHSADLTKRGNVTVPSHRRRSRWSLGIQSKLWGVLDQGPFLLCLYSRKWFQITAHQKK